MQDIFVIDDHALVRRGLAALLHDEPDLRLCGEAASAQEALEKIPQARPHLTITDITLQGTDGLGLIERLLVLWPTMKVLVVSMHGETIYGEAAINAGASGYVMKHEMQAVIISAIRHVLSGGIYVSQTLERQIFHEYAVRPKGPSTKTLLTRLSKRERELLELMGHGLPSQKIAAKMNISARTILYHQKRIKEKLNIATTEKLIQFAVLHVHGSGSMRSHDL